MIFDLSAAKKFARENRTEEWVHAYLNTPEWANTKLSAIIQHQNPIWIGPVEVELTQLLRCCGPEENMRFRKKSIEWEKDVTAIFDNLKEPSLLPPLIVRSLGDALSIADGNHRHEAMRRKGWYTGWVLIWCDRDEKFRGSWRTAPLK